MRNRIRATGTALGLTLAFGAFGATGVAIAGETDPVPPPPADTVTVPVPVPGPTTTVTVPQPSPTVTVTVPTPAPKATTESTNNSSGSGSSGSTAAAAPAAPAATPVAFKNTGVDTGTVPQGGVQAGGGGMAVQGATPTLLAVVLGLFAFGLTSGGVALRRRAAQH
jgi:hypothetical protein